MYSRLFAASGSSVADMAWYTSNVLNISVILLLYLLFSL